MNEFPISEEDILTKITEYELSREEGRVWIEVHKPIAGAKPDTCFAIPTLKFKSAKEQYIGKGETEEAALKDCLEKIKGTSFNEILERSELNRKEL